MVIAHVQSRMIFGIRGINRVCSENGLNFEIGFNSLLQTTFW